MTIHSQQLRANTPASAFLFCVPTRPHVRNGSSWLILSLTGTLDPVRTDTGAVLRKSQPPPGNIYLYICISICISGCSLQEGETTSFLQRRNKHRVLVTGHMKEVTKQVNKRHSRQCRAGSEPGPTPTSCPSSSPAPHLATWGQSSPGISCFLPSPLQIVTLRSHSSCSQAGKPLLILNQPACC